MRTKQNTQSLEHLRKEAAQREEEADKSFEEQKLALSANVEELLGLAFDSRKRFAEMQETLVNHKREVRTISRVQGFIKRGLTWGINHLSRKG